jgi:glycosyltransferase involved in cell wall biosynthesis
MTRLRFCLLTTFYPPFNFGGDGVDVQRTARALKRRGHEVTVVHDVDAYEWLSGRHLPSEPTAEDGVEVIPLRSRLGVVSPLLTHQLGRPVVHGRSIARIIESRRPDVVMFNNVSLVGGPGLLAYGDQALKVYVAHEHWLVCPTHVLWRNNNEPCDARACGRCVLSYRRPPQLWRYTNALERQLASVDLFIARSEFSRQKHAEFGFPRPMSVLPYFLPGQIPALPPTRERSSPHARPYFLFVGRLARIKGLHSIIPVFRRYPHADLLVVGDGDEEPALRALSEGMPNVRFVGRVPNEELARYYEHAIASIVPSLGYETFGIVLIEAFRHRTPVLARRVGPFPEIVAQSGGGLTFVDDDELLAGMDRLHTEPQYRDGLAARGYAACREHWSEEVVIGRLLQYVSEALARRRGVPVQCERVTAVS